MGGEENNVVGSAYIKLSPSLASFAGDALAGLSGIVGPIGEKLTSMFSSSATKAGQLATEIGTVSPALSGAVLGVAGLSAAVVGVGVVTGKMASDFQAQMTKLVTQAGVGQGSMSELTSGVLTLAGKVGEDPDSLAQALYHVESSFQSMGITSKGALNILQIASEGARVGGANLVDVTNALDAAIASGIPGVQNYSQAMGALNAIVGSGDMTMQNLADALGTGVMAVVKGYGLSLTDVGAALATFGDNNIRGAQAATYLRMAVQSLAVPTKAGQDALEKMGMSSNQLAKDMQTGGLNKAMLDLQDHMTKAGITGQQTGAFITEAFGKRAGSGLAVLMGQMDRFESKFGDIANGAKNFESDWQKTQDTTKQKLADARAGLDALGVSIGTLVLPAFNMLASGLIAIIPMIIGVVSGVTGALRDFGQGFSAVTQGINGVAEPAAGFARTMYTLGADVSIAFGALTDGWKSASAVGREVGPLAVGFALLGAALRGIVDVAGAVAVGIERIASAGLKDIMDALSNTAVRVGIEIIAGAITGMLIPALIALGIQSAISLGASVVALGELALDWGVAAVMAMASAADMATAWFIALGPIGWALGAIAALGVAFYEAYEHIKPFRDAVNDTAQALKTAFFDSIHAVESAFDTVTTAVPKAWDSMVKFIEHTWDDVTGFLSRNMDLLLSIFVPFIGIPKTIYDNWGAITAFFSRIGHDIVSGLATGINAVGHFFQNLPQYLAYAIGYMIGAAIKGGYDVIMGFWHSLVAGWNGGIAFFTALPGRVEGYFNSAMSWLQTGGSNVMSGLWNGIVRGYNAVIAFFTALPGRVAGYMTDAANWLTQSGNDLLTGLWNGITTGYSAVMTFFITTLPNDLNTWFADAVNWLVKAGLDIIHGLNSGTITAYNDVITFFGTTIPNDLRQWFADAKSWLLSAGSDVIHGFVKGIENVASDVANEAEKIWQSFVNGIKSGLGIHSPSTVLAGLGTDALQGFINGIENLFGSLASTVSSIPGKVVSALGNMGSLLVSSGESLMRGFASGISNGLGDVKGAVSSVLGKARNLLPFSPAKEGPFSGSGWTLYSGQSTMRAFADGVDSQVGAVTKSVTNAMASAQKTFSTKMTVPFTTSTNGLTSTLGGSSSPTVFGGPYAGLTNVANSSTSSSSSTQSVTIQNLILQVNGAMDLTSESDKRKLLKQIRDGLVTLGTEQK